MSFLLGSYQVSTLTLTMPYEGIWQAKARLASSPKDSLSGKVTLTAGDLTLRGFIVEGGSYAGTSDYILVGGFANGWAKKLSWRGGYRSDSGVRASAVASGLGLDTGEVIYLADGYDKTVGYSWTRPGGLAASLLTDLCQKLGTIWWVDVEGITWIGPRVVIPASIKRKFAVLSYDPTSKRISFGVPGDEFSHYLPGAIIADPYFKVSSTEIRVKDGKITVEVAG